jgi:hypothetical protein
MKRRLAYTLALLFVMVWLALPATLRAADAPAPGPHRLALPAPTLRLDGDSLAVPMESWQGRSVVRVIVDGRGPFPFVLDTGAGGSVITKALADSLRLPVEGEAQVGSPLGGKPLPAKIVRVDRFVIGKTLEASFSCLATDLPLPGPQPLWGVLSALQLPGLLVTWDFAHRRIVFRRGSLPAPDDRQVFSYETDPLPTVPIEIAGRRFCVHVDTGSARGLMLPAAMQDSLPLAGPPVGGRVARTLDREMKVLDARLAGKVVMAGREFTDLELELNPAARTGNVGDGMLRDFEVTLDAQHKRIRLRPTVPRGASGRGGAPQPADPDTTR